MDTGAPRTTALFRPENQAESTAQRSTPAPITPSIVSQHVMQARNEISPLLDTLIAQLRHEGHATHAGHFCRIRAHLDEAVWDRELNTPIIALATSTALGFVLSPTAEALQQRIIAKATELAQVIAASVTARH